MCRMDCEIRRNVFHHTVSAPYITGCDVVGTVVETGNGNVEENHGIKVGDRVCAVGLRVGGNARFTVVRRSRLISVPRDLNCAQVACLLRTYMTAYQCLYRVGAKQIKSGDNVLVVGGNGCVGEAVFQLARAAGARRVYLTAGSPLTTHLVGNVQHSGPTAKVYLPREPIQWLPAVRGSMNIVIDAVGSDYYESSYNALTPDGKLVTLGALSCQPQNSLATWLGMTPLIDMSIFKASHLMEQTVAYDIFMQTYKHFDDFTTDMNTLFQLLRNGEINPIVRCATLNEVPKFHSSIDKGTITDMIVCLPFGPEHTQGFDSRDEVEESNQMKAKDNPIVRNRHQPGSVQLSESGMNNFSIQMPLDKEPSRAADISKGEYTSRKHDIKKMQMKSSKNSCEVKMLNKPPTSLKQPGSDCTRSTQVEGTDPPERAPTDRLQAIDASKFDKISSRNTKKNVTVKRNGLKKPILNKWTIKKDWAVWIPR